MPIGQIDIEVNDRNDILVTSCLEDPSFCLSEARQAYKLKVRKVGAPIWQTVVFYVETPAFWVGSIGKGIFENAQSYHFCLYALTIRTASKSSRARFRKMAAMSKFLTRQHKKSSEPMGSHVQSVKNFQSTRQ